MTHGSTWRSSWKMDGPDRVDRFRQDYIFHIIVIPHGMIDRGEREAVQLDKLVGETLKREEHHCLAGSG